MSTPTSITVVATSTYVAAPILQASYTESFALLILVICLSLLRDRRYGWLVLALVAMALTRNIVFVMAPVIATHGIVAYRDRVLRPFPRRQQLAVAGTAVLAFLLAPKTGPVVLLFAGFMGLTFLSWNWLPLLPMFLVYLISGVAETNRAPLNEFWARAKSDALAVKKFMEQRVGELPADG